MQGKEEGAGCGCPVDTSRHRREAPTEAAAETILSYFKPDDAALRKLDRKDLKRFIEI